MEQPLKVTRECIYDKSNQWARWTFLWMLPVFQDGWKKDLDLPDLPVCCKNDDPDTVTNLLEE
jgi:hypothetical protein